MIDYPSEFLSSMRALLAADYPAFEAALFSPAAASLRLNPARDFSPALLLDVTDGAVPWEPNGRYVKPGFRPGADPLHFAGGYYMQDASAMAPARVLNAQPGERVLDLCAAPGGKSGQLAADLRSGGVLIANEPDPARAKALSSNLERLGGAHCAVINAYPDALARKWPGLFDAVLVDAPCSGEGMFRRDEQARGEWTAARAEGCAARQREILRAAAELVKPGGWLVYSTCTFNRAENEENIAWLLASRADFQPARFALPGVGAAQSGCLRLWPHRLRGEGHFVAMLARDVQSPNPAAPIARRIEAKLPRADARPDEARAAWGALQALIPGPWGARFGAWQPIISGDALWLTPPGMPDMEGVKCLRCGLRAGKLGKGFIQADHALAMAIAPSQVTKQIEPDDPSAYLRGETLIADCAGWTLVTAHGLALGWGKGSGGQLKNHLPKGLRLRS